MAIVQDSLYTLGDVNKQTHFFRYDAQTGKQIWSIVLHGGEIDGPRSTPIVDGVRVYGLHRKGILFCLDRFTGNILWSKDFKKEFQGRMMSGWGFSESVLIDGEKLLCAPGGDEAAVVALNKITGQVLWKTAIEKCSGAGYSSIVPLDLAGRRHYVTLLGNKEGMVGIDSLTGKLLWNYRRISNSTANMVTPLVQGNQIFLSSGYNVGSALVRIQPNKAEGFEVQEQYFLPAKELCNMHGSMVEVGGFVYGGHGHNDGKPFCLDIHSGKLKWGPETSPGHGTATVLYAEGHLYFRYQNQILALVEANPAGYRLKGKFALPQGLGTGWQQITIYRGRMYVRGANDILCYDIRAR